MQESRTPAPQSGEPRSQKPSSRNPIPRNRQPHANLDQQRGWGTQHSPHTQSRTFGDQRGMHTGRGRAHSTPRPPDSHSQVTTPNPGPWNPLSTHTCTQGGQRHVWHAGRRCSALDCHAAHTTVRRSRYHTAMGNGSTPRAVLRSYPRIPSQHVTESSSPITLGYHRTPHMVTRAIKRATM